MCDVAREVVVEARFCSEQIRITHLNERTINVSQRWGWFRCRGGWRHTWCHEGIELVYFIPWRSFVLYIDLQVLCCYTFWSDSFIFHLGHWLWQLKVQSGYCDLFATWRVLDLYSCHQSTIEKIHIFLLHFFVWDAGKDFVQLISHSLLILHDLAFVSLIQWYWYYVPEPFSFVFSQNYCMYLIVCRRSCFLVKGFIR